jgi:hypothetical protein
MKIAVFYHAKIAGSDINGDFARSLVAEQMANLVKSGLADAASEVHVGINGGQECEPAAVALTASLDGKVHLMFHGKDSRSEIPTLHALQQWLPGHEDWLVCYFHAKGVTHPGDAFHRNWRICMERPVVTNWRNCIGDIADGFDTVGSHWLSTEGYPSIIEALPFWSGTEWVVVAGIKTFGGRPFWGGNFWWTTSNVLAKLPPLPANSAGRPFDFIAERWLGSGSPLKAKDYAPHWPSPTLCR